jgi:hypothetical protein
MNFFPVMVAAIITQRNAKESILLFITHLPEAQVLSPTPVKLCLPGLRLQAGQTPHIAPTITENSQIVIHCHRKIVINYNRK